VQRHDLLLAGLAFGLQYLLPGCPPRERHRGMGRDAGRWRHGRDISGGRHDAAHRALVLLCEDGVGRLAQDTPLAAEHPLHRIGHVTD